MEITIIEHARKEVQRGSAPTAAFDDAYLARLREGDVPTVEHFDQYFRRLLRIRVCGRFKTQTEDDLIDDVMADAIESILKGNPRDASYLPGYICGICANHIKREYRRSASKKQVELDFDRLSDPAKSVESKLEDGQRAKTVKKVLAGLAARDRNVLVDVFYHERDRDEVCEEYGVTRDQLRMILFHARARFQREWQKDPCDR